MSNTLTTTSITPKKPVIRPLNWGTAGSITGAGVNSYRSLSKSMLTVTSSILLVMLGHQHAVADEAVSAGGNGTSYAIGATIGSQGLGVSVSGLTGWHLMNGDQLQWRMVVSGIDTDEFDGAEFNDIEYEKSDLSLASVQGGVDWFPFSRGWASDVFFSAGLMYSNLEFDGAADTTKRFTVGSKVVNPGDITSLRTDIEDSQVLPYFSVGWGNRLGARRGLDFQAELGLAIPTSDADVTVTAVDQNNFLSAQDIATEQKGIEDDIDGVRGFAMATLTYHF